MFERKSFEYFVDRMVNWTRGVSTNITDFRVGSKIRTIYEAVALILEEAYDDFYKSVKKLVEENLYAVLGFDRLPASYATGTVTFGRELPAVEDYLIPAGTLISTKATETMAPIQYRTTEDAILAIGTTSVTVPVICLTAGTIGNANANSITEFITKPAGVETVTNKSAFITGREEETKDEQKYRFQKFITSRMRGTKESIEYGALTVAIKDAEGRIIDRVIQSVAFEFIEGDVIRKGEVDLYIWNGIGVASTDLINETKKVIYGYYDAEGKPVYGYKPAGILVNVYSATLKQVWLQLSVVPEVWTTLENLKPLIEQEIDNYFSTLLLGGTLIQTALEARIKSIYGVADVKLSVSTDGLNFSMNNITAQCIPGAVEILTPVKPVQYI